MPGSPLIDLADIIAKMRQYSNAHPSVPTAEDPLGWQGIQAAQVGAGSSPEQFSVLQNAAQQALMGQTAGMVPLPVDPATGVDPNLQRAQLIAQLQNMLQTGLADYSATGLQIGQSYDQLTNPINDQGTGFLQELYGKLGIDPATDPNAQSYMAQLAQGQQTSQQNEATDQAWVSKMQQEYQRQLQEMIAEYSSGATPLPGAVAGGSSGGGGGGGGRGHGYGGGGSGGSGGTWKDPSTTDAVTQAAAEDGIFQYPGFREDFVGVGQTPEEQEILRRIAAGAGGLPYNVNKALATTELPNTEAALTQMAAQDTQRKAYSKLLGEGQLYAGTKNEADALNTQAASAKAGTPGVVPLSLADTQRQQQLQSVLGPLAMAPVEDRAHEVLKRMFGFGKAGGAQTNQLRQGNLWEQANKAQEELDRQKELQAEQEAKKNGGTFSFADWTGWVPKVDPEDLKDKQSYYDLLLRAAPVAEEYDPNAGFQVKAQSTKDSSSTKTSQKSKDPVDQIFNNNTDPGYVPYSQSDSTLTSDLTSGGGFGMGMRIPLNAASKRLLDRRRAEAEAKRAEPVTPTSFVQQAAKAVTKAVAKPKPKPAPKAVNNGITAAIAGALGATKPVPKKATSLLKDPKKAVYGTAKKFFF